MKNKSSTRISENCMNHKREQQQRQRLDTLTYIPLTTTASSPPATPPGQIKTCARIPHLRASLVLQHRVVVWWTSSHKSFFVRENNKKQNKKKAKNAYIFEFRTCNKSHSSGAVSHAALRHTMLGGHVGWYQRCTAIHHSYFLFRGITKESLLDLRGDAFDILYSFLLQHGVK